MSYITYMKNYIVLEQFNKILVNDSYNSQNFGERL